MTAWEFRGDNLFVASDSEGVNFVRFSCRFEVIEKHVDIVTGEEQVLIRIANGYTNPEIMVPRDNLTEKTIVDKLTKFGVSMFNQEKEQVLVKEILLTTEEQAPKNLVFDKLGFVNIGGTEYFLADRLYSTDISHLAGAHFASADMKPQGTLKQYRRFLIKEIAEYPKLALALVLGVTAPVAHILKKHGVFYETLLWCLCGESSTGKTTSLLAMLSIFGNPPYLLSNLNATSNALAAQVSAQSGFPFVADEATRSKLDFDELIYSLASGKGKRRCNGDGTLKPLDNYSGAVFFSSEQPVLDKCSEQGGEEARVIEFELNWFDGDSGKAEKLLRFFNSHYGVATEPLASLLLDQKVQKKIVSHFLTAQKVLAKKVEVKDGIDKRIVQRLAIITVSCWLLQKAVRVDFHISKIVDLLAEIFADKQSRICRTDGTERLVQLFVEDYYHNRSKYGSANDSQKSRRNCLALQQYIGSQRGTIGKFLGKTCLWLPTDIFNEILNRQTTYGASTAKKMLHEKGYLPKFGNAYYRWYNFGDVSANAYCVFLPDQTEMVREADEIELDGSLKIEYHTPLIAAFVSTTSQDIAMVINSELASRFSINQNKRLFLHTWGAKEFLLLSAVQKNNAVPLTFVKNGNTYVANSDALAAVLQLSNIKLNRCERLQLHDIKMCHNAQYAQIFIDNPRGQIHEKINDNDPYLISQSRRRDLTTNSPSISSLLENKENII